MRLQLNLTRGATDGGALLEQVLDVIGKELDQMNSLCNNFPWLVLSVYYIGFML